MTDQEFNDLLETRFEKTRTVLKKKATEYARGDRLSNFKQAAGAMKCTPAQACIGMMMKHIVSIIDMVNTENVCGPQFPNSVWDEKIGDAINYLILLEGLVKE